jgi:signal transduction histidine kinase/CheY-like chemotaxis protein
VTYDAWLAGVHPDDRARANEVVQRALASGGSGSYLDQYRVTNRRDGVTRWVEATGRVTWRNHQASRLVGTVQDITERKRAEEALVEADRRKDEFLASLAHELRNPLGAIRMALGVINRDGVAPAKTAKMKAIIDRQSAQLVRLIDDLLDVSRVTRGKVELRKARVDFNEVLDHALESVHEQCHGKGVRLRVATPIEPVAIEADALRFAQVISNLLNNACKFTESGGEISVTAGREGSEAVVRVRDTGMGIPAGELERIFDMFAQVEHGQSRDTGGLGIGLSLAKSLVTLHGGTIEAHSDGPGTGSEFVVRVPALPAQPAPDEAPTLAAPKAIPGPSGRILAVEDNLDALEAVTTMLRLAGHEVETAEDGPAAVAKACASHPEIVLLDIGLPGLDGYEVARRIRSQPWGRDVVLIAMTGWGQDKDKREARAAGFDAHLTKPVDPEELERLLQARAATLRFSP